MDNTDEVLSVNKSAFMSLHSFIVFDEVVPQVEGAKPLVLYADVNSECILENVVGIYITFIQLSRQFKCSKPCEYIETDVSETCMRELSNGVWMALSTSNTSRLLNQSLLELFSSIFTMFWDLPERSNKKLTEESVRDIKQAFSMITHFTNYKNIPFTHVFSGYFKYQLSQSMNKSVKKLVAALPPLVAHCMLMFSRNVIYSTLTDETNRTLAVCLRYKFPFLFPHVVTKQDKLYWIIGLSRLSKGKINVYAPPIIINGQSHPMVALQYGKLKFILILNPDLEITIDSLLSIPRSLIPLIFSPA